ncbi:predicted protein [Naegleria gruberi]|uniref:Phosphodiesterase n=1 Tax=Naegleria gruberi TaxID=5762 RepID=D2UZF3_NAEGR|nr:uncharacterized protein NAEGRDRAFT_29592 [Naegleria gruberi]EFC49940.1 predicted protein [Naegleria gruberi]|eukprot:XP_002682684.1 predicted protein [Naegleria gruberi strain NEG-M]
MVVFLRKLQALLSLRDDIPFDKNKFSLIIKTIAKNSDIVEDEIKDTNPDLEVSAFLNAFVKPRAKSRERAGWRTIANLIRVGVVFKQQTLQTTVKNINAIDSNPGLEEKLKSIDRYDFDVFELNEASRGKPLYVIFTYYLRRFGLLEHFNIDREVLHAFLREIETHYGYNAFHNSIHAADVLQTFMYLLDLIGMIPFLTHEELLAVILAAAMHDFQHPGTTNQFQILSSSDLAITYSDKSVLESHHVASFYRVLQQEKYNILKTLSAKQRRQIREISIGLISATDLSFQGSFMNQLQAVYDVSHGHIDLMSEKSLVLKLCLKLADTANTSKPLYLHFSWISRLQREFFIQGDKEKELGMDVSPFMDRTKCNFTKCQNSFIEYVTYPYVALFAKCFKEAAPILEYSKQVKEYWSNSVVVSTFEEVEQMIRNELAKVNKVVTQSHLGANTSFNTTPREQGTEE